MEETLHGTPPSRKALLALVSVVLAAGCGRAPIAGGSSDEPPRPWPSAPAALPALANDLSKEAYERCQSPGGFPGDVRQALAAALGQPSLRMASGDEPANLGCVQGGDLPRHRLVAAAIGPRYAVIQYETGGIALVSTLVVLARGAPGAAPLLARAGAPSIRDSAALIERLKDGTLWRSDRPGPPAAPGGFAR